MASSYSVGIGVSAWELDFFGRVAALKDVALADYLATARPTAVNLFWALDRMRRVALDHERLVYVICAARKLR